MKLDTILKLADFFEMAASKEEESRKRYLESLLKNQLEWSKRTPQNLEEEDERYGSDEVDESNYHKWCRENKLDYWNENKSKPKPKPEHNPPAITRTLYKPEEEIDDELSEMGKAIYNV